MVASAPSRRAGKSSNGERYDSYSTQYETHPGNDQQDSEFKLVRIRVTILGLTGILSEKTAVKKGRRKAEKKLQVSNRWTSNYNSMGDETLAESSQKSNKVPTVATIAFQRNVTCNKTSIVTHLPSLPLLESLVLHGNEKRYLASWPTETQSLGLQKDGIDRASHSFARVMKPERFSDANDGDNQCVYNSEATIDLQISLGQGKDLIALGVASLVLSGNKEGAEQLMNLPAKALADQGGKVKKSRKTMHKQRTRLLKSSLHKKRKIAAFPCDPSTVYRLGENANLRILVKVVPNETIETTIAKNDSEAVESLRTEMKVLEERRRKLCISPVSFSSKMLDTMNKAKDSPSSVGQKENNEKIGFKFPDSPSSVGQKENNEKICSKFPDIFCGAGLNVHTDENEKLPAANVSAALDCGSILHDLLDHDNGVSSKNSELSIMGTSYPRSPYSNAVSAMDYPMSPYSNTDSSTLFDFQSSTFGDCSSSAYSNTFGSDLSNMKDGAPNQSVSEHEGVSEYEVKRLKVIAEKLGLNHQELCNLYKGMAR